MARKLKPLPKDLPPIYPWPKPKPGKKYGPQAHQIPLFIHWYEPKDRPHNHPTDCCLLIGGSGGGKTVAAIALIVELVCNVSMPGMRAIVGGKNYPLLKRNVIDEFAKRFTAYEQEWDHPLVRKGWVQNDPIVRLRKFWNPLYNELQGSTISFVNLTDVDVARGFNADVVMIEEANLLAGPAFEEMMRRSRGNINPIRHFILTMNPTGDRDWVYNKFNLRQFEPTYDGLPQPIGQPCNCQYCQDCVNMGEQQITDDDGKLRFHEDGSPIVGGEYEWDGGEKLYADYTDTITRQTIPNRIYSWEGGYCPNCGNNKQTTCPGNQYWYRVIRSRSYDNKHNPDTYVQDMKGSMDPEMFKVYVEGEILQIRKGKIYKSYAETRNVLPYNVDLDLNKDIIWTHDFNRDPMCSLICQETSWGLRVIDEIVKWDANEEIVAREFVKRYRGFKNKVLIYGDPTSLSPGRSESRRTSFQILHDNLVLEGLDAEICVQKIEGKTIIPIHDRINNLNAMLMNARHEVRIKINPKCMHIINSLASVNWHENGKEEDKNVDILAKEMTDRENVAPIMTHPSCALGYVVSQRFAIIQSKLAEAMIVTADGTIKTDDKGITSLVVDEELKKKVAESVTIKGTKHLKLKVRNAFLDRRLEIEAKAQEIADQKYMEKIQKYMS